MNGLTRTATRMRSSLAVDIIAPKSWSVAASQYQWQPVVMY